MPIGNHGVVVATFDDRMAADRALDQLSKEGFDQLGIVLRGEAQEVRQGGTIVDSPAKDVSGAAEGAAVGGVVGGILGALAALTIPGVGPILAGGIIASALGFGAAGVVTGGFLGAMQGLGISEEEARYYEGQIQSGRALVSVRAGDRINEAREILRRCGGYQLHVNPDTSNSQYGGIGKI